MNILPPINEGELREMHVENLHRVEGVGILANHNSSSPWPSAHQSDELTSPGIFILAVDVKS